MIVADKLREISKVFYVFLLSLSDEKLANKGTESIFYCDCIT